MSLFYNISVKTNWIFPIFSLILILGFLTGKRGKIALALLVISLSLTDLICACYNINNQMVHIDFKIEIDDKGDTGNTGDALTLMQKMIGKLGKVMKAKMKHINSNTSKKGIMECDSNNFYYKEDCAEIVCYGNLKLKPPMVRIKI